MRGPKGGGGPGRPEHSWQAGYGGEGEARHGRDGYLTGTEAAAALIDTSLSTCKSATRTLSRFWIRSKSSGARTARVCRLWMRTECLAFGVPIRYRAGNSRPALGYGRRG